MLRRRLPLTLLGLLLAGPALWAHDLWIEPSTFTPAPGQRVAVRLRLGQHFKGDPVPRDPKFLERFVAVGAAGEVPIPGVANTEPAGFWTPAAPGLQVLVYDSLRDRVELRGRKFEEYLLEEGLEAVRDERARTGRSAAAGNEVFSRCAKALVAVGGKAGAGYDRVVGLPLELVPEKDPYALARGGRLPVRLLYQGKPLAGGLVVAIPRDRPDGQVSARTDARGRVQLSLAQGGAWLIKAVHMVPAPQDTGAEWESFWASLTFDMPAR